MTAESNSPSSSRGSITASFIILIVLPLLAHFRYSWMGFNPTDDGFILSFSRRIIEGQIPHLDFISIRPVGSPLLHIPFVLFGGDYTFWISRLFVWFEFAAVAAIWTSLLAAFRGKSFDFIERVSFALIIFGISVADFPIMAWHTIDGLLFSSLGIYLTLKQERWRKLIGYSLIGIACLCKQNFVVVGIATLILFEDWRSWESWIAFVLPAAAYFGILALYSALPDALTQLTSQADLLSVGILSYFSKYGFIPGIVYGYVAFRLIDKKNITVKFPVKYASLIGSVAIFLIPLAFNLAACLGKSKEQSSFALFGMALGTTIYLISQKLKTGASLSRIPLTIIILAWSVSLSVGYNSPALACGILMALILCLFQNFTRSEIGQKIIYWLIPLLAILTIVCFDYVRHENVYRDRPAAELTMALDGTLPGGNKIKTNPRTHEFLTDLKRAIDQTNGVRYAIIPDCAGYWVKSTQSNPLPIDWAQGTELNSPALLERVHDAIENNRDSIFILAQKVMASRLNEEFIPQLENKYYSVVKYIHSHLNKVGETELFEIYR